MRWPSCWSYHWWFLEGLCSLVNRYIECNQSVITRGCMQRITWFAYYSTFFAMSIIKIHSFPPFCVRSLFLGLFIYYVIFVQSIFCIYTVLTLHFNTSNLFPYKKSTAKPFPEPGGKGGEGLLTMKAYTWGSARQGDLFQVSYKYMKGWGLISWRKWKGSKICHFV